ncbi:MAG: prolyl oligopeptidase family serine peptidase, partial [Pseudomonadota bacterium]
MLSLVAAASLFAAPFSATFAFGRTPPFTALEVSPNGDMVAANFYDDGIHGLQIFDLPQNRIVDTWEMEPGLEISKFYWKRDDLLVIGLVSYRNQMAAYWGLSGLITRAPGEDKIRSLFPDELNDIIDKDNVVAWLPDDPDHILVMYAEYLYTGNGVYKINLNDPSQHEVVMKPQTRIVGYVATQDGQIRGRAKVGSYGRLNWSLKKANGGWRNITRRMTNENTFFDVYGFPQDERYAYVGSNHETDTVALYLFDIQSGDFLEQIYHDPSSDLYGIVQRPSDGEVVGVKYADTRIRIRWLEQGEEESRTRLIERSLDADLADMITITPDETTAGYVVQAGSRPERVIIFDFDANSYTELPGQYPELEGVELARVISTSYKARDGLEIPAFVTLPPGINTLEEARDLPFVVLPHGGPNVRDFETFDWLSQFIAFRQHGVLQMNFRGSRGYGQAFMEQGNQAWGQAMQDDIT